MRSQKQLGSLWLAIEKGVNAHQMQYGSTSRVRYTTEHKCCDCLMQFDGKIQSSPVFHTVYPASFVYLRSVRMWAYSQTRTGAQEEWYGCLFGCTPLSLHGSYTDTDNRLSLPPESSELMLLGTLASENITHPGQCFFRWMILSLGNCASEAKYVQNVHGKLTELLLIMIDFARMNIHFPRRKRRQKL